MAGQNVPITIIENSEFINCFGSKGGAINILQGGGIYMSDSKFYLSLGRVTGGTADDWVKSRANLFLDPSNE